MMKSLIFFLEEQDFQVDTASNGRDGAEMARKTPYDAVLLDQYMPGHDGLNTLNLIKSYSYSVPVVMVTKAEDRNIIDSALSERVDDYLIKPVNPNQLIATLKKLLEKNRRIRDMLGKNYSESMKSSDALLEKERSYRSYAEIHHTMSVWNLNINRDMETDLVNMHSLHKEQLNSGFAKYINSVYADWIRGGDAPVLSHKFMDSFMSPLLKRGEKVFFLLIDCMRYDHYLMLETYLREFFKTQLFSYYSILPTATPYSRNSIFSSMLPLEMYRSYPEKWEFADQQSQNQSEEFFMKMKFRESFGLENAGYQKISTNDAMKKYFSSYGRLEKNNVNVLILNIMDIFTHYRSQSDIIMDIFHDENSLLSFVSTWARTSDIVNHLKNIASKGFTILISSDHGSIISKDALLMHTGKDVSINLKYKFGSSIQPQDKNIITVDRPEDYGLPVPKKSDKWYLATGNGYLIYSTKVNQYRREYMNTFQHGGVSMEEMILPVGILRRKD